MMPMWSNDSPEPLPITQVYPLSRLTSLARRDSLHDRYVSRP